MGELGGSVEVLGLCARGHFWLRMHGVGALMAKPGIGVKLGWTLQILVGLGSQGDQPSTGCPSPPSVFPGRPAKANMSSVPRYLWQPLRAHVSEVGRGVAPMGSGLSKLCLPWFLLVFLTLWLKSLITGNETLRALPSVTQAGNKQEVVFNLRPSFLAAWLQTWESCSRGMERLQPTGLGWESGLGPSGQRAW